MLSKSSWNEKLKQFKNANVTQIWEFGEIARVYGRGKPKIYRVANDDYMIQAIKFSTDKIPFFTYITIGGGGGGPCFRDFESLKEGLKKIPFAIRTHIWFPEVIYGDFGEYIRLPRYQRKIGYSWVIDIKPPEVIWREQFDNKQRNMIRKAIKKGVTVKIAEENELEEWIPIKIETQKRIGQLITGKEGDSARYMFKHCKHFATLLVAKKGGRVISGFWLLRYNDIAYYSSPASSQEAFKTGANNLLIWEALKMCYNWGVKLFDFWGVTLDKNSPAYGVSRFKMSFGGRLVKNYEFIKTF